MKQVGGGRLANVMRGMLSRLPIILHQNVLTGVVSVVMNKSSVCAVGSGQGIMCMVRGNIWCKF